MIWKPRNLRELGQMVVGDVPHFHRRSSKYITEFFENCDLEFVHRGETRPTWAAERIEEILAMPHASATAMPDAFVRMIQRLLDRGEVVDDDAERSLALAILNITLAREGWVGAGLALGGLAIWAVALAADRRSAAATSFRRHDHQQA